jgi:two-component system, NarL family, nitrate/nitrite response regulator NarL
VEPHPGVRSCRGADERAGARDGVRAERRVLVVDDHRLLADCLAVALSSVPEVTARAAPDVSPAAVTERVRTGRFALVLLDLDLGAPGTAVRLLRQLAGEGTSVLVLADPHDERRHAEALAAGATEVLDRSQPLEALVAAVARSAGA